MSGVGEISVFSKPCKSDKIFCADAISTICGELKLYNPKVYMAIVHIQYSFFLLLFNISQTFSIFAHIKTIKNLI